MDDLYKLEKKDIDKAVETLSRSFCDYPLLEYIMGEKYNKENVKIFLKFMVKYAVLYGEAYAASSGIEGIILFTDFENYNFTLVRVLRCGGLSFMKFAKDVGRRFKEFDEFSLKMHKNSIKDPHKYLMMIGVDPEKQSKGFGKKLLLSTLKLCEDKGEPCYLETHSHENVVIYKKYGFKVVSKDTIPGTDIIHFSMVKDIDEQT